MKRDTYPVLIAICLMLLAVISILWLNYEFQIRIGLANLLLDWSESLVEKYHE